MVCVYCRSKTQVVNSRHQVKTNSTWRRRECTECGGIFTTQESMQLGSAIVVHKLEHVEPFSREKLWASIHDSIGHRKSPLSDATALTDTILGKLLPHIKQAKLDVTVITDASLQTLQRFDTAAASYYQAYHTTT